MSNETLLSSRRELFFAYDIKMGNPNGDPDENRPRVLPDGTYYVTDVRLKRFIRDYFKSQGKYILVDTIDSKTTNLTGRVAHFLRTKNKSEVAGSELVDILLESFIDARLFGSSFAFKEQDNWKPKPVPKTLTGALQFNHGEVMHKAEAVDIHGTTTFGSDEDKSQGTFTTYFALRYAFIGFNGVANEHSAKLSKMTDEDYKEVLKAMWKSVRGSGNTRTKVGQVPRILISINYRKGVEYQFGNLSDYIKLVPANGKDEKTWSSPDDYIVDLDLLKKRLDSQKDKIESISYETSPDVKYKDEIPPEWLPLNIDTDKNA
ncbi:type I-B CRISPR-associated protein Cas7/Csh2 [Desulfosarcina ovata subsp. sediminis]|uniref:Type I-B CRISPR-associated protein Cas7/Csh2 n=1 Tax=Desulfosarcina ovata subsp. sediminis TaxID=885957 RepID=A0A5K7ZJ18_9BACT|nr:type I-B CRISPR-associated protein Cas7/Csh2 [Desulfosarcina ovata]BBO82132.1 type I-B CRISPR-associated protein Cas7/Csh2 [Desulfosarcina ovata subsp. sediminis]